MNKKGLLIVPVLFPLLTCSAGCVIVNKAISTSAVADNLAVEKAQNEMLLLNVLRGKDHRPMYVTGISKINGQVTAEAVLGVTVPFGDVGAGHAEASQYVASPSATYSWNPNFDVNVFDTSEFMRGFMTPVDGKTFKYYLDQGYPPEFLFHLLVLQIQVKVKHKVCEGKDEGEVDIYSFRNNHESGEDITKDWQPFAEWVDFFLDKQPHFEEEKPESLGPALSGNQAVQALVKGLKEGLTLVEEPLTSAAEKRFQFQRLAPAPVVLHLDKRVFSGDIQENAHIRDKRY